jgi:hypothetical protein
MAAKPTGTVDRYDINKAVREELSDIIYNIAPEDTPLMSNIGRGSVGNTYFEWQTDGLAAANGDNAQIDGGDAANDTRAPTNRLGNYTQIMSKTIQTSGTAEAVNKAGYKSVMAYEKAKASSEIKRDMEVRLAGGKAAVGGSTGTARQTAGFAAFLTTNVDKAATGTAPTLSATTDGYPNAAYINGTARAFTETILKNVIQQVWASGGTVGLAMVGAKQKGVASGFAGLGQNRFNQSKAEQTTIIGAADVYVSDFGNVTFVPNRFMPADAAYLVDPEYASVQYLRDFRTKPLAENGDSKREMLLVEFGLKVHTEKAHGIARDLT